VATDGKRLAKIEKTLEGKREALPGVIVPVKCMQLIEKICVTSQNKGETVAKIKILESQICAETGNSIIISRLVEGHYPDYEAVVPKDNNKFLQVDVKEFSQLISEGSVLGDKESNSIKFTFEGKKIVLSSRSVNVGEAVVESEVDYDGDNLVTAFNPVYIQEALKAVEGGVVKFEFKDGESATAMTIVSLVADTSLNYSYIYVVMPLDT
ncbi:MAG: hypothetical protein ABIH42_06345, partial [Planctomycetota bacterium]